MNTSLNVFARVSSRSLGEAGIFQGHQLVYKEGGCQQEGVCAWRSQHDGQELLNLLIVLYFGEIKYREFKEKDVLISIVFYVTQISFFSENRTLHQYFGKRKLDIY